MTLLEQLNRRYAVRQFDTTRHIADEDLHQLTEAMRLTPSSFGLQPWKFIVIKDKELRQKLNEHSHQEKLMESSHLIVICARNEITPEFIAHYIDDIAKTRNTARENLAGFEQSMVSVMSNKTPEQQYHWADQQAFIALGFLLSAAAQLQIDAAPMGGFDGPAFDKVLGLDSMGYHSAVIAAIGYRSPEDTHATFPKVRFPEEEVVLKM